MTKEKSGRPKMTEIVHAGLNQGLSRRVISEMYGITPRQVQRAVAGLREHGVVLPAEPKERFSNRDIVAQAFAMGIPREEIPEKYKEFGITRENVKNEISHARGRGESTYELIGSQPLTPKQRQHLSDVKKGVVPVEAIKSKMTVWPTVFPLAERGFTPAEMVEITGLTHEQVYNALHEKRRKNMVSKRYSLPEVSRARSEESHRQAGEKKRGVVHITEEYDAKINLLARHFIKLGLVNDISAWDELHALLSENNVKPGSKKARIILEVVLSAKKRAAKGNEKAKKTFHRFSMIAEEVLYRKEDYNALELVRSAKAA